MFFYLALFVCTFTLLNFGYLGIASVIFNFFLFYLHMKQKLVDLLHIWSILIEMLALWWRLQVSLARPPQWPSRSRCLCCRWARARSWCRASPRGSVQTFWWTWRMFCLGRTWTETACSPGYRQTQPPPENWFDSKWRDWEFWRVYGLKSGTEQHYWENTLRLRDGYLTLLAPRGMKKQTLTLTDGGKLSVLSFNDGASAF